MSLDIVTTGKTTKVSVTDSPAEVDIGNMIGIWITGDVDFHVNVDGSDASTSDMIVWAKERCAIVVAGVPNAQGTLRKVSVVLAEGASDGSVWITEAC